MQVRFKAARIACASAIATSLAFALAANVAHAAAPTAYVTTENAGVGVIDLDTLALATTWDVGKDGPRGLSLNKEGTRLYVANKATSDLSEIDTSTGKVTRRAKIGKNPEFVRVFGGYAYVTYEPGESGGPPKPGQPEKDDDDANSPPAEIAIVDLKTMKITHTVKSGHETEGVEFSPDGKLILVTNEGDDTVSVYRVGTGKPVRTVNLDKGSRPRGIKVSPDGKQYVVTLENANKFVVLDGKSLKTMKTVDTKTGPYGVSFDPSGKRLLIAASRDKTLQVFDGSTYEHRKDVPVGQRCWHFSFTPDGSKLLLACGRSNAVYVLDGSDYKEVKQIGDLPLAWGIVTYPPSAGSIVGR
ncbi:MULTISPECIES: beta-propeller fold lactonase family protein [unclassified Caballeronia]|uniref:beta-propeller fold lactonase family protein n=1 Tax=unclassified Caballeronia TaxID=2646786 RepID=UPI002027E7DF|nr:MULTISPECIES: glutaminyl-peptide cyclotransferase [unclassified Caballeronia]MDR5768162.1 beta-propeller fold lactonase family protein [Caballeronia sp. LZ028]